MAIELNPNTIKLRPTPDYTGERNQPQSQHNTSQSNAAIPQAGEYAKFRSDSGQQQSKGNTARQPQSPGLAYENHIPSLQSLQTLVTQANDDARKGKFWDRGSILNLIV